MDKFTEGIAFIMEGKTEKVFYKCFLDHISTSNVNIKFDKEFSDDSEIYYTWLSPSKKIIIKIFVVGTISQITHSASWFANKCSKKMKIPWTVYLCYDTDSPNVEISKFYEGDWKLLRADLTKAHATKIIDLAASADIEDIMLCDIEGICNFLNIPVPEKLIGRKGKAKMKRLHMSCGLTYHEADRALPLIRALDFNKIMQKGPIDLKVLKQHLLE